MDLTQGEFVDDFEFDVMVDGKVVKGYKSDTPHILRLRKEISDLPSEYDRENTMRIQSAPEKIARGVAGAIAGIGTGTWYGSQTAGAKGLNYLEKIGLGWASIFSEKVFGEESDLYKSIQDRIYNVSQMDNAINDTVIEIGKRNALTNKKIAEKLQLEDSFFTDLGSGLGSLIPSLGWLAITKNPVMSTALLTLPQAQNILSERLESGEDVDTALAKSSVVGLGIGILERFGAQNLIEGLATKTILGGMAKGYATEGITGASQQALESFAQNDIRKQSVWQIVKDIAYSGFLEGAAGGAGAGVVGGSYALYKNKVIKDLKKANPDLTDEDAQMTFAYMHSLTPEGEQAIKELVEQGLTKDQASLVAGFNERLLTDEKLRSVVVPPVVVKAIQEEAKDDEKIAFYTRQHLNEELDIAGYADESIDKTIDLIANTYNETLQKIKDESDIRGLVNIEGFKPKEKEGIEDALQVFADAEAEEFGITQREVLESTGLTIRNLTERGDISEEEIEEFYKTPMTPSENVVEVFDDGTYKTEDGYYHDSDGTVLFQKEQFDIADRINEIDKQERLAGVPMYDKETININGVERPVRNSEGNKIAESEKSLRMFYNWFNDSKVVDKQGRPLVVYHGTKAKFDKFNLGFENEGRMLGNGVYLTNSVDKSNKYGNILMKPYVSLQNPLNINSENALKILAKEFKLAKKDVQGWFNYYSGDIQATLNRLFREYDLTNKAKEKGYDGIIYNNGLEIVAFSPNQIKSTSNRGTFLESENIYYQSAYAGSRVDYEKPSLEAIGSGEGAQVHGWGLYYALNKDVAEVYREKFVSDPYKTSWKIDDVPLNDFLGDLYNKETFRYFENVSNKVQSKDVQEAKDNLLNSLYDVSRMYYKKHKDGRKNIFTNEVYHNPEDLRLAELAEEKRDFVATLRADDISINQGQVHEVDIPENPYLLDEQKMLGEQSPLVKKALREVAKQVGVKWDNRYDNGKYIYDNISNILGSQKSASQMLEKYGIKGITYDGNLDGRCFVIFNPDDVKVIQKFYQTTGSEGAKPYGKFDITNDAKQLLDVLRSGNLTTLPHELAHFFTINRIKNAIKFGKTDSLNGLMKFFNVNNPRDLLETERLERLAQMGVNYIIENEAPTASLRRFFNVFKRFAKRVVDMWTRKGFIDANKIPNEVRDFYDSLFGLKQPKKIDIQSIVEQKEAIIEALKKIKKGEKVNIAGLPISQVRELMKARNLSIPRLPQSLKTALIQYGGINLDYAKKNDLINIMGMQDDSQKNKMFKKDGAIRDEQSLIEFMELEGFIPKIQLSDYVDLSNQFDLAMQALDNINETYRIDDIDKVINRERVLDSIEQAEDILKSLGEQEAYEIIDAIDNTLMGRSVVEKEYLESLKRRINNLDRDYKKFYKRLINEKTSELLSEKKQAVKDSTQEIRTYRDDVIDFIKSQNLDSKDIVKLISLSKKANSKKTFENVLNEIFKRSNDMYKKEQARILSDAIQKEVKTKRPKLKEQKYDYEENKLFADLREWNKLTNEKAGILFEAMSKSPVETREDEIRLLFLNYKASGANASPELMNKLLEYIQTAKRVGMETRSEKEFQKKMELRDDKQTMLDALNTRKGGTSLYIKTVSNLNSSLNALFGRDFANKYELDSSFNKLEVKSSKYIDRVVKPAMEVYDVKNKGQFLEKLSELGQKVATLTTVSEDLDTPLSKQGITVELSKIEIMDIYNAIKNNKTRDDYYYWYGKKQIDNLISLLSQKERIFADMMMQSVNDRYDSVNKVFIDTYYTDLPRVDNYWMATSEHKEENDIMTLQQDYGSQSATPSFLKERVKTRVLPKPANAYQKYVKHIKGTFYVTEVAQKQAKLLNLIESLRVKNAIENKFDKNTYNVVHNQITSLSYGSQQQDLDFVSGVIDKVINNFVVAKIALGVPVFVGQLSSVILYSNSMNTATWAKDFALGVANPKKTIEFMEKYVGDYMKNRFAGGYDQTINMILKDSEKSKKFGLNPKHHYNMMNVLTSFVRAGDMGAVIFGGYPRLKNLLENNTEEEAVRQFILETERTQQSNIESTKSAFEKNKGLYRIFTSFKSFQFGMTRKIADDIISALNGDISSMQAAKTVMVGGVVSAAFWVFIKNLYNALVWGMDDDEELTDGIAENILMQNISIIPFVEEISQYALKKHQGKFAREGIDVVGVDDIFRSVRMLYRKKELDVFEWGEVISPFIEGLTSLPSGRILRDIEKIVEKFE